MRALTPETTVGRPLADAYEHLAARLAAASQSAVEAADVAFTVAPDHTGADLAFEHALGERVLDGALDQALERTRAVDRVVPLVGQLRLGVLGEFEAHAALG